MIKTIASPIYETLLSFSLYKRQTHLKYLGITKKWQEETTQNISEELHSAIMEHKDLSFEDFSVHLIEKFPGQESFTKFIEWVSDLSAGQLYEMLIPYCRNNLELPFDLEKRKHIYVELMSKWYEQYYKNIEKDINPLLFKSVEQLNQDALRLHPVEEVLKVSRGFQISGMNFTEVLLFPSWHFRPLSLIDVFNNKLVITFPCLSENRYEDIMLKTKALADETRLKILSYLNAERKSFPEIVDHMNMTKGNIHHHLLLLRSAGLLEISLSEGLDSFLYKFRKEAALELSNDLLKM